MWLFAALPAQEKSAYNDVVYNFLLHTGRHIGKKKTNFIERKEFNYFKLIYIYIVTVNLRNQSLRVMTESFSHFT